MSLKCRTDGFICKGINMMSLLEHMGIYGRDCGKIRTPCNQENVGWNWCRF